MERRFTESGACEKYNGACDESVQKAGVREAVCTMWQDNGAETPMLSGLPSIIRFAEHGFAEEVSEETIDAQLEFLTGCSAEALNLLGSLDHVNSSCTYDNPSKFLLYQDVLTGLFDAQTKGWDADAYYAGLRDRLNRICEDWRLSNAEKTVDESVHASACLMLEMYGALADALSVKADLGKKYTRRTMRMTKKSFADWHSRIFRSAWKKSRLIGSFGKSMG